MLYVALADAIQKQGMDEAAYMELPGARKNQTVYEESNLKSVTESFEQFSRHFFYKLSY
jgi:hypothetical protein